MTAGGTLLGSLEPGYKVRTPAMSTERNPAASLDLAAPAAEPGV